MFFSPFCGRPFFFGRGLLLKRESRPQEARTHIRLSWRRRRRRRRREGEKGLWGVFGGVVGHWVMVQSPSSFLFILIYPILPLFAFHLLGMEENKMAAGPGKGLPSFFFFFFVFSWWLLFLISKMGGGALSRRKTHSIQRRYYSACVIISPPLPSSSSSSSYRPPSLLLLLQFPPNSCWSFFGWWPPEGHNR